MVLAWITVPAFVAALFIANWRPWGLWIVAAMMAAWVLAAIASGFEEGRAFGKPPAVPTWRERFRLQPLWTTFDALVIVAGLFWAVFFALAYLSGSDFDRWFEEHRLWFWGSLLMIQLTGVFRRRAPQRYGA